MNLKTDFFTKDGAYVGGCLLLNEAGWPLNWDEMDLDPSSLNFAELRENKLSAVAILSFGKSFFMQGSGDRLLGAASMAVRSLQAEGWRVIYVNSLSCKKDDRPLEYVEARLKAGGVRLASDDDVFRARPVRVLEKNTTTAVKQEGVADKAHGERRRSGGRFPQRRTQRPMGRKPNR